MSGPLLCVTVTAPSMAELRRRRDEVTNADLVELRLDSVADPDIAGALADRRKPVVVTCRPTWEGGHFTGAEEERHQLLAQALAQGAEYVDIEWRAHFDDLLTGSNGRRVVLSSHDFDGVPEDLTSIAAAMRSTGAEVIKLAVKATRLTDCVTLRDLGRHIGRDSKVVLVGMGDFGLATRILAGECESVWTYAGSERHVGQLSLSALLEQYRFRSLTGATELYGVTGLPVTHSVSPAMHNAAFAAADVDAVYLPLPAIDAADFMTFARAFNLKGASITIPHKVSLSGMVDETSTIAARVGAINTVRRADGRWIGTNTDVEGFLRPLRARMSLPGVRAAIVGAGGAARAVAVALTESGCDVSIHARTHQQAVNVAARVSAEAGRYPPEQGSWDLLINCTSVGMYPAVDDTPIDAADLTGRCVYDLVYNPAETRLLRDAAARGCETIGGLEMLVGQAEEQFLWWTGTRPAPGVMGAAAMKRLAEFRTDEHYVV